MEIDCVKKVAHCNWSEEEILESSTWRELKAVYLALEAFKIDLLNRNIVWFTDNQNIVSIVMNGSKVISLHQIALAL